MASLAGRPGLGPAPRRSAASGWPDRRAGRSAGRAWWRPAPAARRREDAQVNVVVWLVALLVILIGSRETSLLSGVRTPAVHWPGGPVRARARKYLGGWWSQGLGGTRPVPTGMGLSAVLGLITFGANGLPRTLLVVGPLFRRALGMWRLARAIVAEPAPPRRSSSTSRPAGRQRRGTGSLSGLLVYGALPWTLHGSARSPRRATVSCARPTPRGPGGRWVRTSSCLACWPRSSARSSPCTRPLMVGAALAFAIASLIVGERAGSGRMLLGSLVAGWIALVLNLPWALGVLPSDAPR